jgi:ABC-type lipoprotein export system ATPase subunit
MLLNPSVLLLDEPTGPLDEDSVARVETLLQERMASGMSVLMVTHDPKQAQRLSNQRYRMAARRMEKA